MTEPLESVDHTQSSQFVSPWSASERVRRALWGSAGSFFAAGLRNRRIHGLFWLGVFDAEIEGTPFRPPTGAHCGPLESTLTTVRVLATAERIQLGEIEIGARAVVAQEAYLNTGSHDFSRPSMPLVVAKITIGEDAFVGARAFVMPGIKIGARAIVGACSVVTKDVPENVVAAGNPCRILHPRKVNRPTD